MSSDSLVVISTSGRMTQFSGNSDLKFLKGKSGNNSPIKHLIFSYFSNIARNNDDKYWEDFFMSAAKNIFPRNFRFDGKNIQFKIKNKAVLCNLFPIPDVSIEEKYKIAKEFIFVNSGLISVKDAKLFQKSLDSSSKQKSLENKEITWSSFTSSKIQIMFLTVFCELKAKEFNFTKEQKESLIQSILCSVFMKDIVANDITIKNGSIYSIKQLFINEKGFTLQKNHVIKRSKSKTLDTTSSTSQKIPINVPFTCSKAISNWEKKYI